MLVQKHLCPGNEGIKLSEMGKVFCLLNPNYAHDYGNCPERGEIKRDKSRTDFLMDH